QRADGWWPRGDRLAQFQSRNCEIGETLREILARLVDMIGRAIVEQVPVDLDPDLFRGFEHRQPARPVIIARRVLDPVPAQSVAQRQQAEIAALPVIVERMAIVTGGTDEVEPDAVAPPVRRAFEPSHEEAVEGGKNRLHRRFNASASETS